MARHAVTSGRCEDLGGKHAVITHKGPVLRSLVSGAALSIAETVAQQMEA